MHYHVQVELFINLMLFIILTAAESNFSSGGSRQSSCEIGDQSDDSVSNDAQNSVEATSGSHNLKVSSPRKKDTARKF